MKLFPDVDATLPSTSHFVFTGSPSGSVAEMLKGNDEPTSTFGIVLDGAKELILGGLSGLFMFIGEYDIDDCPTSLVTFNPTKPENSLLYVNEGEEPFTSPNTPSSFKSHSYLIILYFGDEPDTSLLSVIGTPTVPLYGPAGLTTGIESKLTKAEFRVIILFTVVVILFEKPV